MKLKQLLISTASIAALAVVPMSIVSCGNNNNNSVEGLPPANDGNNSNPGNGDNNNKPGEDNNNQQPTIQYIDVNDRKGMLENILKNNYITSEFIKQVLNKPPIGEVTYAQWDRGLIEITPGNVAYHVDGTYHYYNVKNLTFTIKAGKVALYYSVNNENTRHTISASGSWTISVELNFRSTTKIENV